MKSLILILLVTVSLVTAINHGMFRRRKEFAQTTLLATAAELTTGEFKDFSTIATAAAERTLINTPGNKANFIIGDAGGSGTRLYIGFKDSTKVLQLKSPLKAAEKPKEAAEWIKSVRDVFPNKGKDVATFIGATAGMRMSSTKLSAQQAIACGADAGKSCKMMVLPGAIEGILGWADGTHVLDNHSPSYSSSKKPKTADCYLEIGSTSSQIAIPLGSGKIWVMSAVNVAFGLVTAVKTAGTKVCNGADPGFSLSGCKTAVQDDNGAFKAHWDAGFKKCVAQTGRPESLTCTKILVRQMPPEIAKTLKTNSDEACKTPSTNRDANFRCALSFGLGKFLGEGGLGLAVSSAEFQSVPDTASYGVEWAWGLYNIMNSFGFDMSKISFSEHASPASDCGTIEPSKSLAITNWIS